LLGNWKNEEKFVFTDANPPEDWAITELVEKARKIAVRRGRR
jgi:hypothetical protein